MQHKTMKNGNFELNTIFNLDCVEGLAQMQPESVDFVLTSPPYDNLRRYGDLSAWNFEKFQEVAQLLAAVIKPGGVIVWVVGDSTVNGSETGSSFRQALYFKDNCSLNLYDTMIFAKSNPIPGNQRRYQQAFEYMFVFSKGTPTAFNPIVEKCQQFGRSQQWGRSNNLAEKTAKHLRANDIRKTLICLPIPLRVRISAKPDCNKAAQKTAAHGPVFYGKLKKQLPLKDRVFCLWKTLPRLQHANFYHCSINGCIPLKITDILTSQRYSMQKTMRSRRIERGFLLFQSSSLMQNSFSRSKCRSLKGCLTCWNPMCLNHTICQNL